MAKKELFTLEETSVVTKLRVRTLQSMIRREQLDVAATIDGEPHIAAAEVYDLKARAEAGRKTMQDALSPEAMHRARMHLIVQASGVDPETAKRLGYY